MIPRVLLALILFDLIFLPMFHLGPFPYKFGYFGLVIFTAYRLPAYRYIIQLSALFILLSAFTLAGWIIHEFRSDQLQYDDTFTLIATYLLSPMALWAGMRVKGNLLNWIPHFILGYFVVNIAVMYLWEKLVNTAFGDFYWYVPGYLGPGLEQARVGGLHQNPHVSALFMTILLLALAAAVRRRHMALHEPLVQAAILAAVTLPFILASRSELVTAIIVIVTLLIGARKSTQYLRVLFVLPIFGALIIISAVALHQWQPQRFPNPLDRLGAGVSQFSENPFERTQGLGRPFRYWISGIAPDRLSTSPLVGTGAEGLGYHNDLLQILVASGIVGGLLFLIVIVAIVRIEVLFVLPFLLAGTTNAFVFTPQHFIVFMIMVGAVWQLRAVNPIKVYGLVA